MCDAQEAISCSLVGSMGLRGTVEDPMGIRKRSASVMKGRLAWIRPRPYVGVPGRSGGLFSLDGDNEDLSLRSSLIESPISATRHLLVDITVVTVVTFVYTGVLV